MASFVARRARAVGAARRCAREWCAMSSAGVDTRVRQQRRAFPRPWLAGTRSMASTSASGDPEKLWPSVRALLATHGVDAKTLMPGSGPRGGLTKADVLVAVGVVDPAHLKTIGLVRAANAGRVKPTMEDVKPRTLMEDYAYGLAEGQEETDEGVSKMRRVIASRLAESKGGNPHAYASVDVDVEEVAALRKRVLDEHGVKVSVNDCVMYAVGRALREVPELNAGWDEKTSSATEFKDVDVCVAVATEDGLITPIVSKADRKSLTEIGAEVKALAKKARDGSLKPHEFMGGSFSVSNLGMFGIDSFSAILNPPQGAILAVGAGKDRVVLVDGQPATRLTMTATVSVDRRVGDEADAAKWLDAFAAQFKSTADWRVV
jgi:pyruvate dehydrogenase E2 component (dihydrolipoamide acetyltransferase)